MTHWLSAYACDASRRTTPTVRRVGIDEPVLVGREGDVAVAAELEDTGVSRRAVVVTATREGWDLRVTNRNGVVVHPWGQPPVLARAHEVLDWPRIGLRVRGAVETTQHWVLLETESVALPAAGPVMRNAPVTRTAQSRATDPLTAAQVIALETVFDEYLRWPPLLVATPRPLKRAARQLGLSETGVKDRLLNARRRAEQLGLHSTGSTTDPEYLFSLVRAGLLRPPARISQIPAAVEAAAQQPRG